MTPHRMMCWNSSSRASSNGVGNVTSFVVLRILFFPMNTWIEGGEGQQSNGLKPVGVATRIKVVSFGQNRSQVTRSLRGRRVPGRSERPTSLSL
jgi:hypothetical protein